MKGKFIMIDGIDGSGKGVILETIKDHYEFIFDSVQHLEPKCPKCLSKIDFGTTTKYDEKRKKHICIECGHVFK